MEDFEKILSMLVLGTIGVDNECTKQLNGKDLNKINKEIVKSDEQKDYIIDSNKKFKGYIGEETELFDIDGIRLKIGDIVNIESKHNQDVYISCVVNENNREPFVMGIETGFDDFVCTKVVDNSNVKSGCVINHCKYVRKLKL